MFFSSFNKSRLFFLLGIFFFIMVSGVTQEMPAPVQVSEGTQVMTLSQAVYSALEYNRELRARRFDKTAAAEAIREAQSAWWPQVGFRSSWNKSESDRFEFKMPELPPPFDQLFSFGDVGFTGDVYENMFQVSQLLYDRTVIGNIKLSELQQEAAQWQETGQMQNAVLDTILAFLNVLAAAELLEVQKQRLVLAQEQLDTAQMNFDVGLRILTDVLRAKLTRSSAMRDVVSAEILLKNNQAAFNRIIGLPIESHFEFKPDFLSKYNPPVDIIETIGDPLRLYGIAEEYHPSIQVAALLVDQSKESVNIARGEFYPRVSAGARWGYNEVGSLSLEQEEWAVSAQVEIPIFEGFRKTSKVKRTKAQLSAEMQRYEDTVRIIQTTVEQTLNALAEERRNLEIATEAEQVAEENHKRFLNLYQEGLADTLDVTTALTELVTAQSDVIQTRYGYLQVYARLVAALGVISTDDAIYETDQWLQVITYRRQTDPSIGNVETETQ